MKLQIKSIYFCSLFLGTLIYVSALTSAADGTQATPFIPIQAAVHLNNYSPEIKTNPTILHILYTGESLEESLKTFADPDQCVSIHYLISEKGVIYQLVPETCCAWHAGKSSWGELSSINKHSIGIALVNTGISDEDAQNQGWSSNFPSYPSAQIQSLIRLSTDIMNRFNIKPWNVVGHSDIAPDRKFDPGLQFPWEELARKGIGLWPKQGIKRGIHPITHKEFFNKLHSFGYGVPDLDSTEDFSSETYKKIVAAFQAHYRSSKVDGIIDTELNEILDYLLTEKERGNL